MGEGFGDAVVDEMEFAGGDAVGRENVNDVAERAKQDSGVEKKFVELWAEAREIAGIVGAKFDGGDGADGANVADRGMISNFGEALLMNLRNGVDAVEDRLVLENSETGDGGSDGDGISGVRMAVIEGASAIVADKRAMNFFGANGGCERKDAAGDSLG